MRLSSTANLPPHIVHSAYDRVEQKVGIVHFGIGAFHRAHQAWYTDAAMNAGERDWAITGVSLRSASVAEQLNPQDGLYTLVEQSAAGVRPRLIGSVREVLVASHGPYAVAPSLIAPKTHIVSFTITEKGYCRAADGSLDLLLAGAGSFYPLLANALRQRRAAGIDGLTLLSCDNLADNGKQLERLMHEYLSARDPDLLDWFVAKCTCPSTMVDRIVPATTGTDQAEVSELLGGIDDHACVITEPFSQWVIEDRFAGPRPGWEKVGAELVSNVRPYETAKLRMLNGAHSLLAYCGLARGHTFVHEAIADPKLSALAWQLMLAEAAPTIVAAPAQDLNAYAEALIDRFANPALNHRLIQIAMDGSQKLPQRWLETLAWHQARGAQCPAILTGLGAWIKHLRGANGLVDDPCAAELAALASGPDPVAALFDKSGPLASQWLPSKNDRLAILAAL